MEVKVVEPGSRFSNHAPHTGPHRALCRTPGRGTYGVRRALARRGIYKTQRRIVSQYSYHAGHYLRRVGPIVVHRDDNLSTSAGYPDERRVYLARALRQLHKNQMRVPFPQCHQSPLIQRIASVVHHHYVPHINVFPARSHKTGKKLLEVRGSVQRRNHNGNPGPQRCPG